MTPMQPEPCDTGDLARADEAVREQRTRRALGLSPCGWLDLYGQGADRLSRIPDIKIVGEWL